MMSADPAAALARLEIARARAMVGDSAKAKAKAAYQDFITLWKDADSESPILRNATAEFRKLLCPRPDLLSRILLVEDNAVRSAPARWLRCPPSAMLDCFCGR
jgi:hypothetical protein